MRVISQLNAFLVTKRLQDYYYLSVIQMLGNGATYSLENLEQYGTGIYFFLSGKSYFPEGQEDFHMLLGF